MEISINSSHKPIGLCSDHAGFEAKSYLIKIFDDSGIKYVDFGTSSSDSCDYPDFAHKLGYAIDKQECELGIAVCGTGNGINIVMNKHQSVRAALCWNVNVAKLSRAHNNANVLSLPGRLISEEEIYNITDAFLNTPFDGGRHQRRIDKIPL